MNFFPEVAGEFGTAVRDDSGGHSMQSKNVVKEDPGDVRGSVGRRTGHNVDLLRYLIRKDCDGVKSSRCSWQQDDEVHGHSAPALVRYLKALEQSC